jgi:hypothetical protein
MPENSILGRCYKTSKILQPKMSALKRNSKRKLRLVVQFGHAAA